MEEAKFLSEVEKCLAFCNHLEITVLRVDTISPPVAHDKEEYEKRFNRLAATWRSAAEACRKAGVILVWEFEPGFWLNKPSEVLRIVEAVGHDNFKLLFDTSHAYMGAVVGSRQTGEKETLAGGVAEYAKFLEGQIGHLHLIDSDGTLHHDETSTHSPFGKGHVDFKEVLTALEPSIENFEWWCVDFCFCPTSEQDGKDAVPFLKKIISEL